MSDEPNTLGSRLRAARVALRLSQAEAAQRAGCSRSHWSFMETGRAAVSATAWAVVGAEPRECEGAPMARGDGRPRMRLPSPSPEALRALRGARTQAVMAAMVGVSREHWSRIERDPSLLRDPATPLTVLLALLVSEPQLVIHLEGMLEEAAG